MRDLLAQFPDHKKAGAGYAARCPAHRDDRASLSIGTGKDGRWLLKCHAGCETQAILDAAGLTWKDLAEPSSVGRPHDRGDRRITATYDYVDEQGVLLYQAIRFEPKGFRQRRPDGAGGWLWNLQGVRMVLFGLPTLKGQRFVCVTEGEKDALALRALGFAATTNAAGAGKWRETYTQQLVAAGAQYLAVLPDNDTPGLQHADTVARSCAAAGLTVKVVALPGLPPKGDVSDWLAAGGTADELRALMKSSAVFDLATAPSPAAQPSASATPDTARRPVLVRLADVQPTEIRWLWPSRIAAGKLTLVCGDPGLGKSWLTLDVASRVSMGSSWPDGGFAPEGDVILLTAEDALDDTIRPRLDALGADVTRIHALTAIRDDELRPPVLARDLDVLERVVTEKHARLVVVDPLSAYLGDTDSHRDSEVRSVLAPLAALAERTGVAVVGVMHLGKGTQRPALYRAIGSIAFVAAARLVLAVVPHPEDDSRRLLAPLKSNICTPAPTLAYQLEASRLTWDDEPVTGIDTDALLGGQTREDRESQSDAGRVIGDLLEDEDAWPLDAKQAIEAGEAHGIPARTMRWTAKRMGIAIQRSGFGKTGRWQWHRPETIAATSIGARSQHSDIAPIAPMEISEEKADAIGATSAIGAMKSVLASIPLNGQVRESFVFDPRGAFRVPERS